MAPGEPNSPQTRKGGARSSGRGAATERPARQLQRWRSAAPGRRGGPSRAGTGERVQFLVADAALGPTTISSSPLTGTAARANGSSARSCSTSARRRADARRHVGGAGQVGDHRQPHPPALLRGLPGRPPPPLQRLSATFGAPLHHRPRGGPRHHLVHAEFGHQLDGELGPLTLRQCLHDDQVGSGAGTRRQSSTLSSRPSRSTAATTQSATAPQPVRDQRRLPHPSRRTRLCVMALGAVETNVGPLGKWSTKNSGGVLTARNTCRRPHRRPHRRASPLCCLQRCRSSCALYRRRTRPGPCRGRRRCGGHRHLLAAQRGQLAQQPLLVLVDRVGVRTSTCTCRSPRAELRSRGTPFRAR